jgi:hypothetical protein
MKTDGLFVTFFFWSRSWGRRMKPFCRPYFACRMVSVGGTRGGEDMMYLSTSGSRNEETAVAKVLSCQNIYV